MWIWIVAIIAVLIGLVIANYNGLVRIRQFVRNAWADVDVHLKKRADLIPNLVAAVKAYASHEQTVLTAVVEARAQAAALNGPTGPKANAESSVGQALVNVLAVAENYPELKSNDNFCDLQQQLTQVEHHIAEARRYYNACVRDYNTKIEAFPSTVVAAMMGLKHEDFFELDNYAERAAPSLSAQP